MRLFIRLLLITLIFALNTPLASALLLRETLASGESLHKSLRSLQDNHGYSWQLVAFKAELAPRAYLRLVGFPTLPPIAHRKPLRVQMGVSHFTVADETPSFGQDSPPATVAQYPLDAVLSQGDRAAMVLSIPSASDSPSDLHIPQSVVKEWWAILEEA